MKRLLALAAVAATAVFSTAVPASAADTNTPATSGSWSGWVDVHTGTGKFTDVRADFTVPKVSCAKSTYSTKRGDAVTIWVGMDGWPGIGPGSDPTVEQDGISVTCASKTAKPVYQGFFEMVAGVYHDTFHAYASVTPGEAVLAEVQYTTKGFVLSLTKETPSGSTLIGGHTVACATSYVVNGKRLPNSCARHTAELVTESPNGGPGSHVYGLLNYGHEIFGPESKVDGGPAATNPCSGCGYTVYATPGLYQPFTPTVVTMIDAANHVLSSAAEYHAPVGYVCPGDCTITNYVRGS